MKVEFYYKKNKAKNTFICSSWYLYIDVQVLNWRTTLKFPKEYVEKLTPASINFVQRLICDHSIRLGGINGSAAVKAHPWFKGVDFDSIHELEAPHRSDMCKQFDKLETDLKNLDVSDPAFEKTIETITCNFDDFPDEPLPGAPEGRIGGKYNIVIFFEYIFISFFYEKET